MGEWFRCQPTGKLAQLEIADQRSNSGDSSNGFSKVSRFYSGNRHPMYICKDLNAMHAGINFHFQQIIHELVRVEREFSIYIRQRGVEHTNFEGSQALKLCTSP